MGWRWDREGKIKINWHNIPENIGDFWGYFIS